MCKLCQPSRVCAHCGNLTLHLHQLISSAHFGRCQRIRFSSHYKKPPVLLLFHYLVAFPPLSHMCVRGCPRMDLIYTIWCRTGSLNDQSCFDQAVSTDQQSAPSNACCGPKSHVSRCTHAHSHTHTVTHRVVCRILRFPSPDSSFRLTCKSTSLDTFNLMSLS